MPHNVLDDNAFSEDTLWMEMNSGPLEIHWRLHHGNLYGAQFTIIDYPSKSVYLGSNAPIP